MFLAAVRLQHIKDLKALSVFFCRRFYRHAGPTDLKRCFSRVRVFLSVGRGPVPRRALGRKGDCGGQAPALRAKQGFSSCAVRDQAIPNYRWAFGFRAGRAIAGDRPPRYVPLILQIVKIV